jgi:hypothetical protein
VNAAMTEAGWHRGLRYVWRTYDAYFASSRYLGPSGQAVLANPLLPVCLLVLGLRWADRRRAMLYVWLAAYGLYVVGVGGERLGTYRFSVPTLPILYVMIADGVRTLFSLLCFLGHDGAPGRRTAGVLAYAMVVLVAYGQLFPTEYDIRRRRDINRADYVARKDIAAILCRELGPG